MIVVTSCGGGGGSGAGVNDNPGSGNNTLPPLVTSFAPTAGAIGATVRIEGLLFGKTITQNTVKFNGVTATIISADDQTIVAKVPMSATTGLIQVTT